MDKQINVIIVMLKDVKNNIAHAVCGESCGKVSIYNLVDEQGNSVVFEGYLYELDDWADEKGIEFDCLERKHNFDDLFLK